MRSFINDVFWGYAKSKTHARIQLYFCVTLFLVGIVYWISFFDSGNLSFSAYDWDKEAAYLDTLRIAQTSHVLPWQWGKAFFQDTDKFLANPEIVLTPDTILLRWISNGSFVIFHVVLFYTLGFVGSLLLAKKLAVGFFSFAFFGLVFNFNGYLTSHLAVGHFQWTGYFLLPFFFLQLLAFTEASPGENGSKSTAILGMALLLGVLFLNGSVHIAIWCSMFLGVVVLLRWDLFLNVIGSVLLGFVLGLARLVPANLWFPRKGLLLSGYPTFSALFDAFTSLRLHSFAGLQELIGLVGWWEHDVFIGFAAFTILVISLYVAFKGNRLPFQPYLLTAAACFFFLSLGNVYGIVNMVPLPFVSVERLPSRFIVMPFLFFLMVAMTGIERLLHSFGEKAKTFLLLGFLMTINELFMHFYYWRLAFLEASFKAAARPAIFLVPCMDQTYISTVYLSWAVSLTSFMAVIFLLIRVVSTRNKASALRGEDMQASA